MRRSILVSAVGSVLALVALGWVTWIVVEPRYWLPTAYAEKGERGDVGRRGPIGAAASRARQPRCGRRLDSLASDVDDVRAQVAELERCDE